MYARSWLSRTFWLIALFAVACGAQPTERPVAPVPTSSVTATQGPSARASATAAVPIASVAPTVTHTPTATATRTATAARRPTATATFWPTFTSDERLATIAELMNPEGDCALPCWWEIMPGATSWQSATILFQQMGAPPRLKYYSRPTYVAGREIDLPEYDAVFDLEVVVEDDKVAIIAVSAVNLRLGDGIREKLYGSPAFRRLLGHYGLSEILSRYGAPDRVLLWAIPNMESRYSDFNLLLLYSRLGLMAGYQGSYAQVPVGGEPLRICPQVADIMLWLWPPDRVLSAEDLAEQRLWSLTPLSLKSFLDLEQSTGTSVVAFYGAYKDPTYSDCLETPRDIWR